jgi:HAD superfamily hydrolase (TIGR01509 family)
MKVILVDAIYAFIIEGQGMFREMYDLLETYPNRKIILTGASGDRFVEYGLDKMPYEVFTLANNPPKSDSAYYKKMLEHFGLTKDDVIYFEHNLDAVKSAQSVGITTHYYDPDKKDLEALKNFLDSTL